MQEACRGDEGRRPEQLCRQAVLQPGRRLWQHGEREGGCQQLGGWQGAWRHLGLQERLLLWQVGCYTATLLLQQASGFHKLHLADNDLFWVPLGSGGGGGGSGVKLGDTWAARNAFLYGRWIASLLPSSHNKHQAFADLRFGRPKAHRALPWQSSEVISLHGNR